MPTIDIIVKQLKMLTFPGFMFFNITVKDAVIDPELKFLHYPSLVIR